MKANYNNLIEALAGLKEKGFENDFNIERDLIHCRVLNRDFTVSDFEITEYHLFEDGSDADGRSIIYALETKDGHKGILLDSYGTYSNPVTEELLKNIDFKK